ncbi:efflux RND transporter periplasmic adaptor subunit [Maribacter sp. ANRC-HE7]|uniref:Efflux RND transporter periplasmic adaptor subunit n=1 Tax=Maribacter aquimaris TaxID=2737171 RepID=A0ABR7V570_9FLAO|nr:efflux RND transporter periplasmic adaptor subunit [Maribacter aquimaris]MBD0778461.1 efflux RND transporter periplasmic adaptor subunit [Maribacter aquimaris]
MKKSKWIILMILAIALLGYVFLRPKINIKKLDYNYTALEKGNIEANVSSTGTVEAINTVEIGTQISGTIKKIYVDYNDQVTAGQILAEMDLKLLNTNLTSAKANLGVSEAQLSRAKDEYERNLVLYEKNVISTKEFTDSKYAYNQALSTKKAAEAAVDNIAVSMDYAHITSPIDGTVIERSVEEGQTVAASFATPTLFIIAEDLSKMQILADLDESDIGYIKDGMPVRFTVQTYPEKEFYGSVSQIRLQPIEINNVVNYQVVVDVDNKKGLLLPGMTANLEFIINAAKDVLLINNSALRFRPTEAMLKEIKPVLEQKAGTVLPDSVQQGFIEALNHEELFTPANFKINLPATIDGYFFKNEKDELDFRFIETGIKTGLHTEIKHHLDDSPLQEGIRAINGIKTKN